MRIVAIRTQGCPLAARLDHGGMDTVVVLGEFLLVAVAASIAHGNAKFALAGDRFLFLAVCLCVDVSMAVRAAVAVVHRLGVGFGGNLQGEGFAVAEFLLQARLVVTREARPLIFTKLAFFRQHRRVGQQEYQCQ
jgi:hypothetical protein